MDAKAKPGVTIALCGAAQAVGGGLAWSIVPALMPAIAKDLAITPAMGGVVWGAAALGIAVAAPFGGSVIDRFGVRRVVPLALIAGALACAARAVAVGPLSLAFTMFLFGAHIGFCAPAIPKVLAGHVPIQKLGRANGAALLCYTLGTAATILLAPTVLVPALGGWRAAMVASAVAMLAVAALWALLITERGIAAHRPSFADVVRLSRDGQLRRLAAMQFLLFGGYLAMLGILPRALIDAGLPATRVGEAIAGWLAVAAVANLVGPWASDRLRLRRPFLVGGSLVAGGALAAMAALPTADGALCLLVAAIGGGAFAPLLLTLPLEIPSVGPARAGAAVGLLLLVGQIGGFLLPILAGGAAQLGGAAAAIGVLAVAHLAISFPASGLLEPFRGDREAPSGNPAVA